MDKTIIGNSKQYAIGFAFDDETRETELSIFIDDVNILEFQMDGIKLTTKWNNDELVLWLRNFIDNMCEDPYPVSAEGQFAAEKDINARDFDSDDDYEFDAYYDLLDEWNNRHRWHPAASGAILADLYFQFIGGKVEISWNNQDCEENVSFTNVLGGCSVDRDVFVSIVEDFLREYAMHWFN